MQVTRTNLVAICTALRIATKKKGKPIPAEDLLEKIREEQEGLTDENDQPISELAGDLLQAFADETEIEIKATKAPKKSTAAKKKSTTKKTTKKKSTTKAADSDDKKPAKKKPKTDPKPKKEVIKDKLGSRKGSIAYEINACLSKKAKDPKTLQAEVSEAGTETTVQRVRDHLRRLHGDDLIEKTDKGFKLK